VGVPAGDSRAGKDKPLLGTDDVDDAVAEIVDAEQRNPELGAVGLERFHLGAGVLVGNSIRTPDGGDVMIGDRERRLRSAHLQASAPQAFEGLRAVHLGDEMTVDVDQAGVAVATGDHVAFPEFLEESPLVSHARGLPLAAGPAPPSAPSPAASASPYWPWTW